MKTFIAVSESHGRAGMKTHVMLDKYMGKIGHRTWSASLSNEGIADVIDSLRKVAKRSTAVAIHMMSGNRQNRLVTVIGRRNRFSENGRYPVSTSKSGLRHDREASILTLAEPMISLAASFHDIGKLTEGMQTVLASSVLGNGGGKQPVRHELVSQILMMTMWEIHGQQTGRLVEREFLLRLASEGALPLLRQAWKLLPAAIENLHPDFDRIKQKKKDKEREFAKTKSSSLKFPDKNSCPFIFSVMHAVLTHHRMPDSGIRPADKWVPWKNNHITTKAYKDDKVNSPAPFTAPCLNWEHALSGRWDETVRSAAAQAVINLEKIGNVSSDAVVRMACTVVRTSLIFGDHVGSSVKVPSGFGVTASGCKDKNWIAHANSMNEPGIFYPAVTDEGVEVSPARRGASSGRKILADTLSMHTSRVNLRSIAGFRTLMNIDRSLPSLGETLFPEDSGPGVFEWQDNACRELVAHLPESGAALINVVAGTGTGKTRGCLRLACTGYESARVSCALSLRSLTIQSGNEYISRLNIPGHMVSTIIGDEVENALQSLKDEVAQGNEQQSETGTDADISDNDINIINPEEGTAYSQGVMPSMLNRLVWGNPSNREFLETPVIACTVDKLIAAADAKKSGHLVATLRCASSSLILDEFDSYEAEDIQVLCRLIYVFAFAGRRVVISSATLSPVLARAAHSAYSKGMRDRKDIFGLPSDYAILWCSQNGASGIRQNGKNSVMEAELFKQKHTEFIQSSVKISEGNIVLRKAMTWDVSSLSGNDYFRKVSEGIRHLHDENYVTDPVTGRRFSVGFTRWSKTRNARKHAEFLFVNGMDNVNVKILCYHARFASGVRAGIDRELASMLTRKYKPGENDPIFSNTHVRNALDNAVTEDVIFVICSSPLIELGRDFDFDWCVIDPSSVSSVIQSAGRVRRHRYLMEVLKENVLILSRTPDISDNSPKWDKPGVEAPVRVFNSEMNFMLSSHDVEHVFPMESWKNQINANDAIMPQSSASRLMETRRSYMLSGTSITDKEEHLCNNELLLRESLHKAYWLSLDGWLENPEALLTSTHAVYRKFRRKKTQDIVFETDENENWVLYTQEGFNYVRNSGSVNGKINASKPDAAWINRNIFPESFFDARVIAEKLSHKVSGISADRLTRICLPLYSFDGSGIAALKCQWNPFLGLDNDK